MSVQSVYERATTAVKEDEAFAMFNLYIKKAAEIYGIPRRRTIYEKAIEALSEAQSRQMCMLFAEMETKLGEIDRARAIYAHYSQMCDPRITAEFWQTWKEFEVRHGNEDTMREMLRIKRSIQATYNTQINMMSATLINSAVTGAGSEAKNAMRALEVKAAETSARAIAAVRASGGNIMFVRGETQGGSKKGDKVLNPDEIDIDEGEEKEDEAEGEEGAEEDDVSKKMPVEKQVIPAKLFGSLRREEQEEEDE
ncbi:pre-mRNA-splicing factor syf1 homolog [Ochlerotatus camptorhynchus]|uniref:pre-mRNA-splicing factor syf1 homolog n=1 Tax=Ochlerotatus camptorhynchus TaxID=644619 RepID=UPI0031DD3A72